MQKRAPPEFAVGATVDFTVAKHVSAMNGRDKGTRVRRLEYHCRRNRKRNGKRSVPLFVCPRETRSALERYDAS